MPKNQNQTLRKSKIITYIIGIISFIIPIKLYLTPPTDYDGGPMLAYNLLFFYPLLIISVILSIVVLFRLKSFEKYFLTKIPLIIMVLPSFILTIIVFINISRISNEPEILDLEIPNSFIDIKVNDTLDIKLSGFTKRTMGENEKIIEKKIVKLIPYVNGKYRFKDGGEFIDFSKNTKIFYKIKNDSLIVINHQFEYDFFNTTRTPLPFKIKTTKAEIITDSIMKNKGFKKFNWK